MNHYDLKIMESEPDIQQKIDSLLSRSNNQRFVLGITGGSGCGKSTISETIKSKLSGFRVNIVHLDTFFLPVDEMPKYFSKYLGKEQPNFNRPDSINFPSMIEFCRNLDDFDLHILEGHFALYKSEMRELMDLKCFITIDIQEMLERRTIRNLKANYGGDEENIHHYNQECILPMYKKYILPCRDYADILIPNSSNQLGERDLIIETLCTSISANFKASSSFVR